MCVWLAGAGEVTHHQGLITVEADEGSMHGTVLGTEFTRLTDDLHLLIHINKDNTASE